MTIDDRFGSSQGQAGQSQTGTNTGARSAEYDDGLTVQDTSHSAQPGTSTMDSDPGGRGPSHADPSFAGRDATPGGTTAGSTWSTSATATPAGTATSGGATTGGAATQSHHDLGDNRDGLGRDQTDALTADESGTLISADKVVGTAVYDAAGERLGTIDSIMLNKRSGKVAYAVMSFGGFLGIGERYHPLPWNVLTYDEAKGGYNVEHSADDLRKAPNYSRGEVDTLDYGRSGGEIDSYYGVDVGRGYGAAGGETAASDSTRYGAVGTGVETADAIGSTTGAGSSGLGSTGMGSNRNF